MLSCLLKYKHVVDIERQPTANSVKLAGNRWNFRHLKVRVTSSLFTSRDEYLFLGSLKLVGCVCVCEDPGGKLRGGLGSGGQILSFLPLSSLCVGLLVWGMKWREREKGEEGRGKGTGRWSGGGVSDGGAKEPELVGEGQGKRGGRSSHHRRQLKTASD